MFAIFLLIFLVSPAIAKGGIEDSDAASEFYGTYKLAYLWPKLNKPIPICMEVVLSQAHNITDDPFTCECERESPTLALVLQKAHGYYVAVLVDIVNNPEEVSRARKDTCHCQPLDKTRNLFMKVNDNYFLYYDLEKNAETTYLLSKTTPTEAEVNEIIDNYEDLKSQDGMSACKA